MTERGRGRRAGRAARDPPPRQPRRRAAFRPALGLARRADREHAGRRRVPARRRPRRSRGSTPGTAGARTAAPASCSSTARGAGTHTRALDGLGTQARQAARAEPPAARRRPTPASSSPAGRGARAPSGVRYVITLDADTRLPRGRRARLVGTLAHPLNRPRFDRAAGRVVEGYGMLQPRVTPTLPAERRGLAVPALFSGPRARPLRLGGVGRLPGPVRRGHLHRQGHLRRRRVRGGAGGPRARERAAEPRPVRGDLRARRPRHRHRVLRGVPGPLRVAAARQHRWARGDWQLLPWILGAHATDACRRVPRSAAGR